MKYQDIVAYNLKYNLCPFCDMPKDFVLDDSDFFLVTLARAPYCEDHLLIIPKRHVVLLNDLSQEEIQDMLYLITKWNLILHKKHSDVNLLLRDGFIWWKIGKSVDHMHFHLIPDLPIGHEEKSSEGRQYLSERKYLEQIRKLKKSKR